MQNPLSSKTVRFLAAALLLTRAASAQTPQEEIATQAPAARAILDGWQAQQPVRGERTLSLVYWTPSDREPCVRYRERLSAVFEETRAFYAREMQRNGFGPRTIRLNHDPDGLCHITLVKGAEPYAHYNGKSGGEIRRECVPVLRSEGIDAGHETIVIFCNMSNWDPATRTMSQNSPYYASGTNQNGTAWQVDSPLLDPALLETREPTLHDGQYGRISPGRYNSIFIGGVMHELGHALGLPHNKETPEEKATIGTALMGAGNRTYGEERRGEGKGTILTFSEAMRLASHPMFCGSLKGFDQKSNAKILEPRLESHGKTFTFSARVVADPPVYAVIGYNDPANYPSYGATTETAVPDRDGRFTLDCRALARGQRAVLHVITAQANGAMSSFAGYSDDPGFPYYVSADGTVDLTASLAKMQLAPLVNAVEQRNAADAARGLRALEQATSDTTLLNVARVLAATLTFKPGPAPEAAQGPTCALSEAAMVEATVGYGRPTVNRLPESQPLLLAGGRLFARGIYAHAPAHHVWALGGRWNRLTGLAALADGHDGMVTMSMVADGREFWHGPSLKEGQTASFDVSVQGVQRLEFQVAPAGDGIGNDWGVWLEPTLAR